MDHQEIKLLLAFPAVRLLRGDNAPMVLSFLHRAFKANLRVTVPESELQALLDLHLEELREAHPDAYPDRAADYLNRWCDDTYGFLRKYYGDTQNEPLYELTSGAEKALLWLDSLRQTGFVGTESRLQIIFTGLEEILKFASPDAEQRIARLNEEAGRLLAEIDRIRATGNVRTFSPVEINERFALILATARDLVSDFRSVEENFRRIARDIAGQHAMPGITKGAIVGSMLDAHEALRKSDQGQSFFAFWELLIAEKRRHRFEETLSQVLALEPLDPTLKENRLLRRLIAHLMAEADKVARSHQRMSVNLRRVLDTANVQDHRRVHDLIREIQVAALAAKDQPPTDDAYWTLEDIADPYAAMSRPLWEARDDSVFGGPIELDGGELGLDDLRRFRNLPQIRLQELRGNVEACLAKREHATLRDLLDDFPPKHGVLEVLGYLIVAAHDRRHFISDERSEVEIPLAIEHAAAAASGPSGTSVATSGRTTRASQRWRVPLVMFYREG